MRSIREVTSEGERGPAYIRFSLDPVARTEPWQPDSDLVVDYNAAGDVVGVEVVTVGPSVIDALAAVARRHDLDLSALVAHSFHTSPAT